jgi:Kef-type K+ transport system membrane component KefB
VILLIVIILVAAALTGTLGGVLEIAAGVAIGLFLFVVGVGVLAYWFARRRWRQASRDYRARWESGGHPRHRDREFPDYRDI